jgi:outer membrane protein TolC
MREAVDIALRNNHQVKQYRFLEDSARAGVGSARAAFFPSLDLGYSYMQGDELMSYSYGGDDGFSADDGFSSFSVTASYNLFSGMSDLRGLWEARASAEASMYQRVAVEADMALAVKKTFIGVLMAGRSHEVAMESVELLERQRHEAGLYYREGLIAKNDLLRVEVELSAARQDLLEAEGDLSVGRRALQRIMGVGLEEGEEVEDFKELPRMEPLTFEAMAEGMLLRRSEMRYLKATRDSYKYAMEAVKGGYLPRVDLALSYEESGDSAIPGSGDLSVQSDSKAVVSASWNLFDGFGTSHGLRAARYAMRAAEEEMEDTREELLLQLKEALEGYRVAGGKLEVARTGVEQAEENYRVTENRLRQREAATVDILDARFFLTRARNQHNNALYDLHLAAATIERVLEEARPPAVEEARPPATDQGPSIKVSTDENEATPIKETGAADESEAVPLQ